LIENYKNISKSPRGFLTNIKNIAIIGDLMS
jgi:hypothetical protein